MINIVQTLIQYKHGYSTNTDTVETRIEYKHKYIVQAICTIDTSTDKDVYHTQNSNESKYIMT